MKVFSVGLLVFGFAVVGSAQWKGSVESSLTFIDSNKKSESALLLAKARQERTEDRILLDFLYSFSRQSGTGGFLETSTDVMTLGGRYERNFANKSFWYASARFDRDGVNNLNLRQVYGAGLGYTLFDTPASSWRMSLGVSQVIEEYDSSNEDFFGLQAQSDYSRNLTEKLSLDHSFLFVPNTDDFSDYFFASVLGLSYKLNGSLSAGFRWIVNFDSTPSVGSVKQSRTYALTLGYKF
ncbi:MAG: DUF481 domain-containing protein [Fimbriimonadaceae bacterium]|nr:DUF481 domain-containing protein [Fimbriimonadaceae bacterium]